MSNEKSKTTYNQRLFGSGFRKKIHLARFFWVGKKLASYPFAAKKVMELGCFDAKTIEFLPEKPEIYVGYDANWEKGLDLGKEKWKNHPEYKFFECQRPEQITDGSEAFDVSIAMETIEHIPVALVEGYIAKMAEVTKHVCLITVPNEKGLIFLMKYIFKRLTGKQMSEYSFPEVVYASLGWMNKVARAEGRHKGYDYEDTERIARKYFKSVHLEGIQVGFLPAFLNVSVAIVCEK